jgi:iduronate 2-sulfatase
VKIVLIPRKLCALVLALVSTMVAGCSRPEPAPEPERLNVLFILVDDLNTRLGAYGDPVVQSPNIDQLALAGVRFDRAYTQYPMCNASRSSLLSGLYPELTGVLDNSSQLRQAVGDIALLPELFRYYGYNAQGIGKIAHHGKTVSWGGPIEGVPVPPAAAVRRLRRARSKSRASSPKNESPEVDATSEVDESSPLNLQVPYPSGDRIRGRSVGENIQLHDTITTNEAIGWLEANPSDPFFLAVGLASTHLPFVAPQRHFDKYPPYTIQLREEPPDHLDRVPSIALTHHPLDDLTDLERREVMARYYACISYLDEQIGRLLATLDRLDIRDRTVVVLTSDHGFLLGEHGNHWRKGSLFAESARVPLIIAGPGISVGMSSNEPAELLDLYPTLVELSGLPRPKGLQGLSLVEQLRDPGAPRDRPAYTIVGRDHQIMGRSIQTDSYRYTEWGSHEFAELYALWRDPFEYQNLAAGRGGQRRAQIDLRRMLRATVKRSVELPRRKKQGARGSRRRETQPALG